MRFLFKFQRPAPGIELVGQGLWVLGWLATTLIALWLRPDPSGHATHMQLGLPACATMDLFHRPCPGCGLTTSVSATVHGLWGAAFRANPFGPPAYLLATGYAMIAFWGLATRTRISADTKWANRFLLAFFVAYVAFGVWRFVWG